MLSGANTTGPIVRNGHSTSAHVPRSTILINHMGCLQMGVLIKWLYHHFPDQNMGMTQTYSNLSPTHL